MIDWKSEGFNRHTPSITHKRKFYANLVLFRGVLNLANSYPDVNRILSSPANQVHGPDGPVKESQREYRWSDLRPGSGQQYRNRVTHVSRYNRLTHYFARLVGKVVNNMISLDSRSLHVWQITEQGEIRRLLAPSGTAPQKGGLSSTYSLPRTPLSSWYS